VQDSLKFAIEAAREAGDATLEYFQSPSLEVEVKGNLTPVTRADREAERLLRARIRERFPDDGILGEEEGASPGRSGRTWILDPIDGTKSFVRGVPLFGTLLALEENGRARLGVVYFPALREMIFAGSGEGAWWITGVGDVETSRPARVSDVDRLDEACFCYTSVSGFERTNHRRLFDRVREGAALDRGWCDCYGHVLVATGRAEVMIDPALDVWDCAALLPIVEEAGGALRDLDGNATHRGGSAVSTNGALAGDVLALVRSNRENGRTGQAPQ